MKRDEINEMKKNELVTLASLLGSLGLIFTYSYTVSLKDARTASIKSFLNCISSYFNRYVKFNVKLGVKSCDNNVITTRTTWDIFMMNDADFYGT